MKLLVPRKKKKKTIDILNIPEDIFSFTFSFFYVWLKKKKYLSHEYIFQQISNSVESTIYVLFTTLIPLVLHFGVARSAPLKMSFGIKPS